MRYEVFVFINDSGNTYYWKEHKGSIISPKLHSVDDVQDWFENSRFNLDDTIDVDRRALVRRMSFGLLGNNNERRENPYGRRWRDQIQKIKDLENQK